MKGQQEQLARKAMIRERRIAEHREQVRMLKKYAVSHGPQKGKQLKSRLRIAAMPGCGQNRKASPCDICKEEDCFHRARTIAFK